MNMQRFGFRMYGGTAVRQLLIPAVLIVTPGIVSAQTNSTAHSELTEIVVTATRRAEPVFNIAKGMSVLSGNTLQDFGLDSFSEYAGLVPSLDYVEYAPSQSRITIRGVSGDPNIPTASAISTYINDTPTTSSNAGNQIDIRLYDVERIEVLRGPQGTLFGENSLGGAIRIMTARPDASGFSASAKFEAGSIDGGGEEYDIDGMVNMPIIKDVLALRAVGSWRKNRGWIDNITTGDSNVNSHELDSGRVALRYTPNADLTFDFTAMINRIDVDSTNDVTFLTDDETDVPADSPTEDDFDLYSLEIGWEREWATINSITSYTHRDSVFGSSEPQVGVDFQNFLFQAALGFSLSEAPINTSVFERGADEDIWMQEIRIVSPDDQRFRWLVGGFYRDGDTDASTFRTTDPAPTFSTDAATFLPLFFGTAGIVAGEEIPGGFLADEGTIESRHISAFGEISYDITPKVTITAGFRWFDEEFDLTSGSSGLINYFSTGFATFSSPVVPIPGSDAEDVIFKTSLSYKPSSTVHLYASYAEGFRSGGSNGTSAPEPQYDPDTTRNYEIGGKFRLYDGRLHINSSVYYIDWDDYQTNNFDITTGIGYISNAGAAHVLGFELEMSAQVTEKLTVTLSGNLTEAETDEEVRGSFSADPVNDPFGPPAILPEGTRLANVPEYKYAITVQYIEPSLFHNIDGVFRFGVRGVDESYAGLQRAPATFQGTPLSPNRSLQEDYRIGNLRVGLQGQDWDAFLYVKNLWDTVADYGDNNLGRMHRNQPRTIGISLSKQFN